MATADTTTGTVTADLNIADVNTDTYDRASMRAAQLEALLAATVDGTTLDGLTPALRSAYLSACADAATEVRALLAKLAPAIAA
jgi:hypothetical protein